MIRDSGLLFLGHPVSNRVVTNVNLELIRHYRLCRLYQQWLWIKIGLSEKNMSLNNLLKFGKFQHILNFKIGLMVAK